MRRLVRRLTVFVGVLGMVMALNVGVAFATNTGGATAWTCNGAGTAYNVGCGGPSMTATPVGVAAENAFAPAGSNISAQGRANGILGPNAPVDILARNPLCPFHDADPTP